MSTGTPTTTTTTPTAASTRNRQLVYALVILLLFGLMVPYTNWLERVKNRHELGEATIGDVDAGGFMLKLALLGGLRGVAANVLWTKAIDLQRFHEWDKLDQTVNLITKLQPHFLSIWTFQSWNLAYNVSVEWDDPADKYEWIKRGIMFVRQGVEKNRQSPDLLWDTAWTYYHKLGFADESVLLRRLFYDDDDEDFKIDILRLDDENVSTTMNDSFEASYGWFTRSVRLVDQGRSRLVGGVREQVDQDITYVDRPTQRKGRADDLAFRTMPAHAMTRFAIAQEKMSIKGIPPKFGEVAARTWEQADAEWGKFGARQFPAFSQENMMVQIGDIMNKEKFDKLPEAARYWTDRWSNDTNYRYWKSRCELEQQPAGVEARRLFYEATVALKNADFQPAADKYRQGLEIWKDLISPSKTIFEDTLSQQDIAFLVKRYALALRQLGTAEPPADTPFRDIYERFKDESLPVDPHDALEVLGRDSSRPSDEQ